MNISKNIIITLISSLALLSCGSDSASNETTYQGAIAFKDGTNGTISIDVPDTATKLNTRSIGENTTPITGNCIFTGGTQALNGGIDANGAFTLSGGDYTFTGTLTNGQFSGSLTKNGAESGTFSGADASANTVKIFCGTFTGEDSGVFLVIVSGTSITGSHASNNDQGNLSGTLADDNTFTVQSTAGGYASGTVSGNNVSGTIYNDDDSVNGSFTGDTDSCAG